MSSTCGFAIVGTGLIADFHARAVADAGGARLAAACGRDLGRTQAFAAKHGCEAYDNLNDMLARPDINVLLIATPSGVHMEAAVAAAEAGKHVLCEKPLDISVERIDQMIAAHDKAGTRLGCIFQLRYMPVIANIRRILNEGLLGTVTYAGAYVPWWRSDDYYAKSSWHGTVEFDGGGALMNQSIHMIDLLCDLMPPVRRVTGFVSNAGHPFIETEDAATAALLFEGGAVGVIYGSTSAWPGQSKRLEICGTKGSLIMLEDHLSFLKLDESAKDIENEILAECGPKDQTDAAGVSDPGAMSYLLHQRCFEDFMRSLKNDAPFCIDGHSARKSVAVIEAVYRSSRTRSQISL